MAGKSGLGYRHILLFAAVMASMLFTSCDLFARRPAVLWTDTPEMLSAVELFNASQNEHLIEVRYVEDPATELRTAGSSARRRPSLVIGRGLRTQSLGREFQSLEYLFGELVLSRNAFYPHLLKGGMQGGRLMFIPMSFNLLVILSAKENAALQGLSELDSPSDTGNSISMESIARRAALFNRTEGGETKRMGFSPRWPDRDFLFQWIQYQGANFQESGIRERMGLVQGSSLPVTWDQNGLTRGLDSLRSYVKTLNGSAGEEDSYAFRYLFAPGYKNVLEGKAGFAAMASEDFFTLSPVARSRFDFRYFAESGSLAIKEDIRYAGIPRRAPDDEAAMRFLRWFCSRENQEKILERARSLRLSENEFGIAGGFSAMPEVTREVFPRYYTDLAGRLPDADMVRPPLHMPVLWRRLKEEVLLPWMDSQAGAEAVDASQTTKELASRITTWLGENPELR
jgi:hypothetical protein